MAKGLITNLLCLVAAICLSGACTQDEPEIKSALIQPRLPFWFIQDGEVCVAKEDGSDIKPITQTEGKVDDFCISPFFKHLAFTREFGMVDGIGLYEDGEEIPQVPIYSIVITKMPGGEELAEIRPEGDWLHPVQWTTDERLFYYTSSGYDISGFYEYDITTGNVRSLEYTEASKATRAGISYDRQFATYTDDVGLGKDLRYRLHVENRYTGEDKIVTSKPKIFSPCLSPANDRVAFIEVQTVDSQSFDVVWIYSLADDSMTIAYTAPAVAKSNSWMRWSPRGGFIGLFWAPSENPNAYLFAVEDLSDVQTLRGKNFCWQDDDNLLFERSGNIHVYSLAERKDRLLIENASKPTVWYGRPPLSKSR